jgi:hypothetical protein
VAFISHLFSFEEKILRVHVLESVLMVWFVLSFSIGSVSGDRLCGLVVRVSGYWYRGPGLYSRRFQIFWEAAGLKRGPLSLVRTTEELLGRKSSGSGLENWD